MMQISVWEQLAIDQNTPWLTVSYSLCLLIDNISIACCQLHSLSLGNQVLMLIVQSCYHRYVKNTNPRPLHVVS